MKKLILGVVTLSVFWGWGAATGSCESKAGSIKVGSSKTVTLVNEYDPEEKEYYDSGVYYLAVTLSRGDYTLWCDGEEVDFSCYAKEASESQYERGIYEPGAGFDDGDVQDGKSVGWMYAEDWFDDDPSPWTYYICIEGEIGDRVTVSLESGIRSFLAEGIAENPLKITMNTTLQSAKKKITEEGSFWFWSPLESGRKYVVETAGGTDDVPFVLNADSEDVEFNRVALNAADSNNMAWAVFPKGDGDFTFEVTGGTNGTPFTLEYRVVASRKIKDHPVADLSEGVTASFVPGRIVNNENFYDAIVDDHLQRVAVAKGERWVFDATGADREVEMLVYSDSGKVIGSNRTVGMGSHDVRVGVEITEKGYCYVGVYNPALDVTNEVVGSAVTLVARKGASDGEESIPVAAFPATAEDDPVEVGMEYGPYPLNQTTWSQSFLIGGRKGITYAVATDLLEDGQTDLRLMAKIYKLSGSTKSLLSTQDVTPGADAAAFTATANAQYLVNVFVAEGKALTYPDFRLYVMAYLAGENKLGSLTVETRGADATWTLDKETVKYAGGTTILVPTGDHLVKFAKVTGFSTPENWSGTVLDGTNTPTVVGTYSDTYDHKDDVYGGATKMSVTAKGVPYPRTFWDDDPADWFVLTAKDGVYYNIRIEKNTGDARMTVYAKGSDKKPAPDPVSPELFNVMDISKLVLAKGDYFVCVRHGDDKGEKEEDAWSNGSYTLVANSANVGAIKFAKTAISVKKNAGTVKVSVNRTAKEGRVRVRYGTVADTAKPGERYIAQSGILEWAANDNKAKSIEIKLIPDLVSVYDAGQTSTHFDIQLKPVPDDELAADEYPAQITADTCTVTITENASKSTDTIAKAYAKTVTKAATVKTEDVALRSGTFYGVLSEDGSALTNGLPQLASVTLTTTVKEGKADTLSAKVALAGKTYTFKTDTKNPEEWEELGGNKKRIVLKLVQTVNKVVYTNELTLTVADGVTTDEESWLGAGGTAELVMNVPDTNNKGVQEEIRYAGDIYRQNAKIQNYLNVVTNFFGYYTMALVPEGVSAADGIPAGNGYLTIKVDNKGKATVAGLLADNTRVSLSVTAAGICKDESSPLGYAMYLPIFMAKSPYCFGGTLRLYAKPGKTLPNKDYEIVVDSTQPIIWNNDNAKLTYYNEDGWRILCNPVGGWYDTVINLQAYYLNYAFEVGGADITEFPTELVANGYRIVTDVQPNGESVGLVNDAFSTAKKSLIKDGSLYDLVNSVNPCNVQVKLARATGIVTGSFSIWSEDEDGLKQKEITGFKHNGVLLLSRDEFSPIPEDVISVGFSIKTGVKLTDENPDTGRTTTRNWNLSLPFNLLGIDQGDIDWWADDWGWNPEWGEEPAE